MNNILTIWKKELKDTMRDRRTLLSTILLPMLLIPGVILGMGKLAKYQVEQTQEKTVTISVVNAQASPELTQLLRETPKVKLVDLSGDPSANVRDRKADLALVLPENLTAALTQQEPVQLVAYQNSLNNRSSLALSKTATAINAYNALLVRQRITQQGVSDQALTGLSVLPKETAREQELGGFVLGFLLPLFIIMWSTIGGQYTAVDVSAGEKERKTLESLLLTPVRRVDIVFGKFFAVATAALASVVIALGSLYAVFVLGGADLFSSISSGQTGATVAQTAQTSFNFSLEPMAILVMLGASILLVALFSAVNLAISIFAKSYKEAQSYIGPSYLVIILPVIAFNSIPGFVPTGWFFALPVVNAVLLFKEVLVGVFSGMHIILTFATLAVTALLAVYGASRIYQREGVLFKD